MTATTISVSDENRNSIIASKGKLTSVEIETAPPQWNPDFLCLADGETILFNIHLVSTFVKSGTVLMSNGEVPFENLTVKSVPAGCIFNIGVDVTT